jgi:hypothetical protein
MNLQGLFCRIVFVLHCFAGRVRFCSRSVQQTLLCVGLVALLPSALLAEEQPNFCSTIIEYIEFEGNKVTRPE